MDQQTMHNLIKVATRLKKMLDNYQTRGEIFFRDIETLVDGVLTLAQSDLEKINKEEEDVTSN